MDPIDLIDPGETITAAWLNLIVKAVNSLLGLLVLPAALGRFVITEGNALLVLNPALGGGTSGASPRGFKCEKSGTVIRVYFGVIDDVVPAGMIVGDTPAFTVIPSGPSGFVVIALTAGDTGGGTVGAVSAEIQCHSAIPADGSPDGTYYQIIGTYNTGGGGLIVSTDGEGIGYQRFELCGGLGGIPQWGPA